MVGMATFDVTDNDDVQRRPMRDQINLSAVKPKLKV
jgi:hypothetical protein